ncbi:glycosyltransferase family 87 protein [Nocardioides solisilvae]|uniref:glycosyltransferase family 87 protein n=1 Tax=Nocardioides solisilvae TaxID=1542435 RepID=UPI000D7461E1|nr:glycosyltransferase 87 family protein [Nocardioides solisilvae]
MTRRTPVEQPREPGWVHATRDDPTVAALSEVVGGPAGSRVARHRWWTPVRVLLVLTGVCLALGMMTKAPCVTSQWQDGEVRYTAMCYSDMPYLYTGRGFTERHWPYSDDAEVRAEYQAMEYPVGISYWAWATSHVTWWLSGSPASDDPDRDVAEEGTLYVAVNAAGFALVVLLSTWLLAGVNRGRDAAGRRRSRPWDAAGFALAPALAVTGLVNWDLLAIGFVAAALWAWSRDRPVLTGVMIGLGTATKLFPLFLLGGVLVLCLRRRRWADLVNTVSAAFLAWGVANLPAWLLGPEDWKVFWSFNSERGADLGSLWLVWQQFTGDEVTDALVNRGSWIFFGAWCGAVLVVGLLAPRPPRLAQLGFLVVAGFLLVNKVYSPQYVLWLLPLAVLARPRWRELLAWQAAELLYFAAVWWYLGGFLAPGSDGQPVFYWVAIVLRVAAELWLVALVTRDVLRPEHDPVDRDPVEGGSDEPEPRPGAAADAPDGEAQTTSTRSNAVAV